MSDDRGGPAQHFLNTFLVRHRSQTQGIPDETLIAYAHAQAAIDQAAALTRIADTLDGSNGGPVARIIDAIYWHGGER